MIAGMTAPITPLSTERLAAVAAIIDQTADDRGWNGGPILVHVRLKDEEAFDLGVKNIDGHPLDHLLGFTAPAQWDALGVCCEGWAAPMDSGVRPSKSKGRMRVRSTHIVGRNGVEAAGMRLAGEGFEAMPAAENAIGMVPDALRRCLGLPTAPPEEPVTQWLARMLFLTISADGGSKRSVGWSQLRPTLERYEAVGNEGTWALLKGLVAKHHDLNIDLEPEVAAWMDDGMFSRWVLGGLPPYDVLLEEVSRTATKEAFTQVRRLLRKWGLRTFVKKKRSAA
jgi:hypothetical protein